MKKPLKYRFPSVLLCFTLILAVTVSGLTFPGFLLPLFGEVKTDGKDKPKSSQQSGSDSGEENSEQKTDGDDPAINHIIEGNSKAFSIEPVSGMTVSAEANALDKDREFKVTEVSDEEYSKLSETMNKNLSENSSIAWAWEFDAGLADNEILPGNFKVDLDLKTLDIDPEDYENTKIFRVDDSGIWYEYATALDGSVLSFESSQNSVIVAVIGWSLIIGSPLILDNIQVATTGAFYSDSGKCSTEVEMDGKKRVNIYWDASEAAASFNTICNRVSSRIIKDAETRTKKELTSRWGEDRISKMYDENGRFKKDNRSTTKEHDRVLKEYINVIKKSDSEFKEIESQINQINSGKKELLGTDELFYVSQAVTACKEAIPFLTKELGVNFPDYMVTMELSADVPANGVVNSPYLGHPYAVINTTAPSLLMTITHEFMHISQRTYVLSSRSNFKFDEAMAGAAECEAFDYYVGKGLLEEKDRQEILEAMYEYQHFAVAIDNFYSKTDPVETYPDGDFRGDSNNSCYPVGNFLKYLKDNIKVEGKKINYGYMLKKYKSFVLNGSVVKLYKGIFGLDDEAFTKAYNDFVISRKTDFYNSRNHGGAGFGPTAELSTVKTRIELENKDYITRLRKINVDSLSGIYDKFALVLIKDDGFKENMPDYKFYPYVPDEEIYTDSWDNGCFIGVSELKPNEDDYELYILETDGGTGKAGTKSGYTLYPVYAPDTPKATLKDNKLSVTFPASDSSPSFEAADGYIIKLYSGDTEIGAVETEKDDIGSDRTFTCDIKKESIDVSKLKNISMTISEYFNSEDNMGPESEKVTLTASTGEWKLISSKSWSDKNEKGKTIELKYSAEGNNFYVLEDWDTANPDKEVNIKEYKATYSEPEKSVGAGEVMQVKVKETVIRGKSKGSIYCDAMYCVSDETIGFYEKGEGKNSMEHKSCDVDEVDPPSGYTECFDVTFPSDKGTTGKLILIYKYDASCGTVYTYKWK